MWKSSREIEDELRSQPEVPRLETLYSLSILWRNAVYPEDYRAKDDWPTFLILTDQGEQSLQRLRPFLEKFPEPDIWLAFFGKFFHHEIFFDWTKTDLPRIRETLQHELFHERIRLPYRYGRLLYDRFNDTYSDTRTDHLLSSDVQRLLQGTPQGVCQLGILLSGPLGILDSHETRYIPPTLLLPLWHCSDTGCNAIHSVDLIPPSIPIVEIYSLINKTLSDRVGPPSEWDQALRWLHRGFKPRPAHPYVDLPLLIADCIVGHERTVLLESALDGPTGDLLRKYLAMPPRKKREAEGPSSEVASKLAPEAQLQLLLVLPNRELVNLIDEAVRSRRIKIPLGETRRSLYLPPRGPKDTTSQLSALGLRSVKEDPLVNLTSAIWHTYQSAGLTNELEWRVRADAGRSAYDTFVAFVRNRGPAEAVRELILSTAGITKAVCEDLHIPLRHANSTDNVAVDRMLWKLGFNPMQFDDSIQRFKARLTEFNEAILIATPIESEDARERVRAAGVNVFVSVEDFLDRLISYNVWLLSSDHFLDTKFRFSSSRARHSVTDALGAKIEGNDDAISLWNTKGENALGTLLRYLRAAVNWIQRLPEEDRSHLRRPEVDLPHFADDEHLPFPFRHVALWADAELTELRRYAELFATVVKLVEESELAAVRNGLDHYREGERFPTADKMLACVARLGQALELADVHRYLPKVFWLFGRKGNRFGSVEYEFRDYAGRTILVYGPPLVSGLPRIRYEHVCLLAPGNLLGIPNSSLIFQLREQSEFSLYWQDYPRRRRIPAEGENEIAILGRDPTTSSRSEGVTSAE
jgi:hypothetical protein